jgi:hypothetical protein
MSKEDAPESWIGKHVIVLVGENLEVFDGSLLEVNDRGLVIRDIRNLPQLEERLAVGEKYLGHLRREAQFRLNCLLHSTSASGKRRSLLRVSSSVRSPVSASNF